MLKRKSGKAWSLKLSPGQEKEAQRLAGTITVKDETFCTQVTMKSCVAASLAQAVRMGFSLMDFTKCATPTCAAERLLSLTCPAVRAMISRKTYKRSTSFPSP